MATLALCSSDDVPQHDMQVPTKWRRLKKLLEDNSWTENRVSGSHYIFVKPGHRCIPLAFHGASVTKRYAKLVLQQAQIIPTNVDTDDLLDDFGEVQADDDDIIGSQASVNKTSDDAQESVPRVPTPKCLTKLTAEEKCQLQMQNATQKEEHCKEQTRRQQLLARIQYHIGRGEYSSAVTSIDNEGIDLVGNSDEKFQFMSDLIFFKLVSLTKRAFEECAFNSTEQHDSILETLSQASRFMEVVCDRRQEIRSLALAIQDRVIQIYLNGANLAGNRYLRAFLPDNRDDLDLLPLCPDLDNEEADAQLHIIRVCLQFIVLMYKHVKEQPFRPERAIKMAEELNIASFILPCTRSMLLLFDMEELDAAVDAANTLLFVVEHFGKGIEVHKASGTFLAPRPSQLIVGIAKHIKALVPVYRFAKDKMKWSRYAGVAARCRQIGNNNSQPEINAMYDRCTCDIGMALTFSDMFIDAIEKSQDYMVDLFASKVTRDFMFDSLLDPIALLQLSVVIESETSTFESLRDFLKDFDESGHVNILEQRYQRGPKELRELRKSKHDKLRRNIIFMLERLQKISEIYSVYYGHLDEKSCAEVDSRNYWGFRFECINTARSDLYNLFSFIFDEDSIGPLIVYKSLAMLLSGLDVAQNFRPDLSRKLRRECETREEMLGISRWSFDLVFQSMMPLFLQRYVLQSEEKRLVLIDGTADLSQLGPSCRTWMESTAFTLVSQLHQLEGIIISESFVRTFLNNLARDSTKSPDYRRWVKNKAKRFTKKIEQLVKSAADQQARLKMCLVSREEAVRILMKKLESCVMQRRRLPEGVENQINSASSRREAIILTTQYGDDVHAWSHRDAEDIGRSMLMLQDAGETATSFLHRATSQKFPLMKSISNSSWTQRDCSFSLGNISGDARNTIAEMKCIHDILQLANASKTGS